MDSCIEGLSLKPGSPAEPKPQDGGILAVVTSKMTGAQWNGQLILMDVKEALLQKGREDKMKNTKAFGAGVKGAHVKGAVQTACGNTDVQWVNSDLVAVVNDAAQLQIWNVKEPQKPVMEGIFCEHDDIIESVSVNPFDRRTLLTASWDSTTKLWDLYSQEGPSDESVRTFVGHEAAVFAAVWCPFAAKKFATASKDATIRLWESANEKSQAVLRVTPADNQLTSLAWSNKNEHHLASGSVSGAVYYFDVRNPKAPLLTLTTQSKTPVFSVQFSPKGAQKDLLAIASDDPRVSVVDLKTSSTVFESKEHTDYVRSLCWSAEGETLFSGSWDGGVLAHHPTA